MKKDALGDRMKRYEFAASSYLTRRTPVIMRFDGKAFHTYVKHFKPFMKEETPFCEELHKIMCFIGHKLIHNIQGAKVFYTQSDEISILLTDFDKITTDAWFDYNLVKVVSVLHFLMNVLIQTRLPHFLIVVLSTFQKKML